MNRTRKRISYVEEESDDDEAAAPRTPKAAKSKPKRSKKDDDDAYEGTACTFLVFLCLIPVRWRHGH